MANSTNVLILSRIQEQIQRESNIKAGFEKLLQASQMPGEANMKNKRDIQMQLVATQQKILELQRQMMDIKQQQGEHVVEELSKANRETEPPTLSREAAPATPELQRKLKSMFPVSNITQTAARTDGNALQNAPSEDLTTKESIDFAKQQIATTLEKATSSYEPLAARKASGEQILYLLQARDINLKPILHVATLMKTVRYLLVDSFKDMRILALRMLKYFAVSKVRVKLMFVQHNIDIFLVRLLTKDSKLHVEERDYALKIVRECLDVPGAVKYLPQSIVRAIVAIAEQPDDRLRSIAIETLCELSVRYAKTAALCDTAKVLVGAITEGPSALSLMCVPALLYLLDKESTRVFLRPQVEIEALSAGLISTPAKAEVLPSNCAQSLLAIMQHWSGLFYLCLNEQKALRALVDSLRYSGTDTKKVLLLFFFELFQIQLPNWFADFVGARGKNVNLYPALEEAVFVQETSQLLQPLQYDRLLLTDCYKAFLAQLFIQQGLLDALISIVQDAQAYPKQVSTRATILIGEILEIANRLLPRAQTQSVYLLRSLFEVASDFVDETKRHNATWTFTNIENMIKAKEKLVPGALVYQRASRIQKQVDKIKQTMGLQMDDKAFQQLIDVSGVLLSKDFTLWNWDAVTELVQGPLTSAKRLEEALNPKTKLVKRLLGFYKPSHLQFSTMSRSRSAIHYVKVGISLLEQLMCHSEGFAALAANELFPQIVQGMLDLERAIVDPQYDKSTCLFHPGRINATLSGYYFHFTGVLSKNATSCTALLGTTFHFFDAAHRLLGRLSDDNPQSLLALDALQAVIAHLDYTRDEHPRVLLSRAMTCGSSALRIFAIRHLRQIMRTRPSDFSEWGMPLLLSVLFDTDPAVARVAVDVCDEACNLPENVRALVSLNPKLDTTNGANAAILLRCLATTEGFVNLLESGFVSREHEYWLQSGCMQYVAHLELLVDSSMSHSALVGGLNSSLFLENNSSKADLGSKLGAGKGGDDDTYAELKSSSSSLSHYIQPGKNSDSEKTNMVPAHFFGDLCKTKAGSQWLESRNTVSFLVEFLQSFMTVLSLEDRERDSIILQCKSVLWALGHIGSTIYGIQLLLTNSAITLIDDISRNCTTLSIRGTCFYVLCLLSKTAAGTEALAALGYESVITSQSANASICLPKEPNLWLEVPNWKFQASWPEEQTKLLIKHKKFDEMEVQILQAIGALGNHIVASAASRNLSKWRAEEPSYFVSFSLYLEVHKLLGLYHYKSTARKYIMELFDRVPFTKEQLDTLDGSCVYQFGEELQAVQNQKLVQDLIEQTKTWNAAFSTANTKDSESDSDSGESAAESPIDTTVDGNESNPKKESEMKPKQVTVGFPILA